MQRPEEAGGDMEHPFSSASRPEGRPVVWIGTAWAPVEHGPMDLPGIVTTDLPEGWALVTWVDKESWYSPEAVFETKFLKELSRDEFERRVTALRESDWPGLIKEQVADPEPSPYVVGDTVCWIGEVLGDPGWDHRHWRWRLEALGSVRGLTRDHPGTVVGIDHYGGLRVRWVDKRGSFEGRMSVTPDYVDPIDADEAARLAQALRESDWPGLAPDL